MGGAPESSCLPAATVSRHGLCAATRSSRPRIQTVDCGQPPADPANPDPAMRRRLHLVPLTFVPPEPDTALPDVLQGEAGGILAWAIDGCLAWQREGLKPPPVVAKKQRITSRTKTDRAVDCAAVRTKPGAREASSKLYADWSVWAQERGERPRGDKWFSPALGVTFCQAAHNGRGRI